MKAVNGIIDAESAHKLTELESNTWDGEIRCVSKLVRISVEPGIEFSVLTSFVPFFLGMLIVLSNWITINAFDLAVGNAKSVT